MKQKTLFDEENRLEQLSQLGDPLEILNRVIKWEKFRSVLNQGCHKEDTGKGGRPPYDVVMMFKILVLQRLYNLSDDQTEYQINDRMSFMRFLGINLCDKVHDAKTIWKFKNDLAETETVDKLFCMFDDHLEKNWLLCHVHAFEYFGGVTKIIVPDNLKTGVTANTRYETQLNASYRELAEYYGTAIVPARVRKPQDAD